MAERMRRHWRTLAGLAGLLVLLAVPAIALTTGSFMLPGQGAREPQWFYLPCDQAQDLHTLLEQQGATVEDGLVTVFGSGKCAIRAVMP